MVGFWQPRMNNARHKVQFFAVTDSFTTVFNNIVLRNSLLAVQYWYLLFTHSCCLIISNVIFSNVICDMWQFRTSKATHSYTAVFYSIVPQTLAVLQVHFFYTWLCPTTIYYFTHTLFTSLYIVSLPLQYFSFIFRICYFLYYIVIFWNPSSLGFSPIPLHF